MAEFHELCFLFEELKTSLGFEVFLKMFAWVTAASLHALSALTAVELVEVVALLCVVVHVWFCLCKQESFTSVDPLHSQ